MSEASFEYIGNELELFAAAKNWKLYVASLIKPFIKGDVLEAGAGIGTNTNLFFTPAVQHWTLLEPDKNFCIEIEKRISDKILPGGCTVFNGYTNELNAQFDTIIYIDVLEHIEDDKKEIETAAALLRSGGHLIALSPAYDFLMSPFDKAIGHFRRYNKKELLSKAGDHLTNEKIFYADSMGLATSLANKYLLKQQYPTKKQISFWDSFIIPVSKITDKLILHSAGRSVIGIWSKK
ncbi:MAG: class I SAM-dependent methyltransferase [Ferruginibacter sp.]